MANFPANWLYTADRGVAMDCNDAQGYLQFLTLGHEAAHDQQASALKLHLAECESCYRAFESQRRFDHEVARAISDVPIPARMKDRLKNMVSSEAGCSTVGSPTTARRLPRRAALGFIASMVPVLIWAWLAPQTPQFTEADVRRLAERDIDSLPFASSNAVFALPAGWDRVRGVQFGEHPRLATAGMRQIPVLPLKVHLRSRSPDAAGFLIRLSELRHQLPVATTSFSSATIQYSSYGSWVAWREGNAVFLCVVLDTRSLEQLQSAIANNRRLT